MSGVLTLKSDVSAGIYVAAAQHLRRIRDAQRLSQLDIVLRMPSRPSVSVLAHYERGDLSIPLGLFVEWSEALGVRAGDELGLVLQQAEVGSHTAIFDVDVRRIAGDSNASDGLRAWAQQRLKRVPDADTVRLELGTVHEFAVLFDLGYADLMKYLRSQRPQSLTAPRDGHLG